MNRDTPFLLIAAVLGASLLAGSASSQQQGPCDSRDRVIALLGERYDEAPIALGVTHSGGLVEVLTDTTGWTWTIIVTSPEGLSCMVLSGEGWRPVQQLARDPEA